MKTQTHNHGIPRAAEFLIALMGLIILLPFFVLLAVIIKCSSRGSFLFGQKRIGRGGREFTLYKFRSMRSAATGIKLTSANDHRVTGIGKRLRKYKLDELPQLWNVLRGDMSLVGPRPEVPEYVDLRNPLWQEILSARPGITDPVTLRLRNEEHLLAAVIDKEAFYVEFLQPYKLRGWAQFVRHKTWKTDIRILCRTVMVILLPSTAPPPSREELKMLVVVE